MRVLMYRNRIEEALPLSVGKEMTKLSGGDYKNLYPELFTDGKDRIYLPFKQSSRDTENPIEEEIVDFLFNRGYEEVDYIKGYTKKDKQEYKIGKILNKENADLLKLFSEDPMRSTSEKLIVICRHPYDIAGQSTDRDWVSCQNLMKGKSFKFDDYNKFVKADIENGTLIAYLITGNDKNITHPLCRVSIKPYSSATTNEVYLETMNNVYGLHDWDEEFKNQIQEFIDRRNSEGIFTFNNRLYFDTGDIKTILKGEMSPNEFCKLNGIKNYSIRNDGKIDVEGGVRIFNNLHFKKLLGQFGEIREDFICSETKLTSLEGCPEYVGRNFNCNFNDLISLKFSPKYVGKDFDCSSNKLTFLEGCPEYVGRDFDCSSNKIISLKNSPIKVGGDFYCKSNKLVSLKDSPKYVGGNFYCNYNEKKFTKEDVQAVCEVKGEIIV
jgi:hypothetical protein